MKDRARFARTLGCMALIALLAISGYMGASQKQGQTTTVSAPIVFETMDHASMALMNADAQRRIADDRQAALQLLDGVINNLNAPKDAVLEAMEKKIEIAACMETEARIEKTLDTMGFPGITALCGGRMTTVIVPAKLALDEKARVQIVDAAANAAKQNADCIKIIPQKNE